MRIIAVLSVIAICAALGYFIGAGAARQKAVPPDAPYADSMTPEQKTQAIEAGQQQLKIMVENKLARAEAGRTGMLIAAAIGIAASVAFIARGRIQAGTTSNPV